MICCRSHKTKMYQDQEELIRHVKNLIDTDNLEGIQSVYAQLAYAGNYNWAYVFQKVYLHACLRQKQEIANYIKDLFQFLPDLDQVAIRQVFHYGNYLLRKKKSSSSS